MNQPPLIECKNIAFERDDVPLFSRVDFCLLTGQVMQVKGANGVGKTTLLRIIATSLKASEGEMFWMGKHLSPQLQDYRANLLYIGHSSGVKASLSPSENLRWFYHLYPCNDVSIANALDRVGLSGYRDVPCHTLSAGQLRRVALARLHLSCARLWVLDEPFTSIDVDGIRQLEAVMNRHLEAGGAIVLTSHQQLCLDNLATLELEAYAR